jgi:hypothetical protein
MSWDPNFSERSPMLQSVAALAEAFGGRAQWPPREALDDVLRGHAVSNARGIALRAVAPDRAAELSYEARVYHRGELEVREGDWHDFFNVLAWTAYPKTKAALNARHAEAAEQGVGCERGRVRDALTLFDESGAIVASSDAGLLEDVRAFRWKNLFIDKRERVRESLRVYLFGHALLEKALAPYVGMTAHALLVPVDAAFIRDSPDRQLAAIDEMAAQRVGDRASLTSPQALAPLPVLGVPGWWPANEHASFYDDAGYFRPGRLRRR